MEALIQHFLIHSQGFTVPAGRGVRARRGPARLSTASWYPTGTNRPCACTCGRPRCACQAMEPMVGRRAHRRRRRHHRPDRHRRGRRGPVSFHPGDAYVPPQSRSPTESCLAGRRAVCVHAASSAQKFEELASHYPGLSSGKSTVLVRALHGARSRSAICRAGDGMRARGRGASAARRPTSEDVATVTPSVLQAADRQVRHPGVCRIASRAPEAAPSACTEEIATRTCTSRRARRTRRGTRSRCSRSECLGGVRPRARW